MTPRQATGTKVGVRDEASGVSVSPWYSSAACSSCLLGVLLLINVFNYLDRALIGTLADPIGRELHISDTEFGILGGFAFMFVYTMAALSLARWVDRGYAKHVIIVSVVLWSLMTSLCAVASGFWWLLVARVGMALGEAGLVPAAQALLAQRFSPAKLGAVLAVFWVGTSLGDALAPVAAGLLNEAAGWRTTFLTLGPLALLTVPLAGLVIQQRAGPFADRHSSTPPPAVETSIKALWSIRPYRLIWLGAALALVAPSAYGFYVVPYLMRAHQLSSGVAGTWLGPALIVAGVTGPLMGGLLFDRLNRLSVRAGLMVPAVMPGISAVFAVLAWQAPLWQAAIGFYAIAVFCHMLIVGPMYATVQLISPPSMRGVSVALFNMGMTLLGGILGPLLAGLLSDLGAARWGVRSLAPALSCMAVFQIGAGIAFARAAFVLGPQRSLVA